RGKRARVASGKPLPSPRPQYGYAWRDETHGAYVVDEAKAAVVRRIFAAYAAGTTLRRLAAELNAEGVPTPSGRGAWGPSSLRRNILARRDYTGEATGWRAVYTRAPGGKPRRHERPAAEQIALPAGTVPALIDVATFEEAQRR